MPDDSGAKHAPESYGVVTAEAVALPEIANSRRRVYSMPITSPADRPGEPSLWSAAVDALAAGTDIGRSDGSIDLLGPPNDEAKRLVIVSAGNTNRPYEVDYVAKCDLSPIKDPAQAWNALVVGASTELVEKPTDPTFAGWATVAEAGEISPHSRTGVGAGGGQWPIKPDICMEQRLSGKVPKEAVVVSNVRLGGGLAADYHNLAQEVMEGIVERLAPQPAAASSAKDANGN